MLVMRTFRPASRDQKLRLVNACNDLGISITQVMLQGIDEYIRLKSEPRKHEFFLGGIRD